jgi:peptidoglycan/LPS O-acetylase OafA/YrhL
MHVGRTTLKEGLSLLPDRDVEKVEVAEADHGTFAPPSKLVLEGGGVLGYRPDIDGLRAVALASVVVYHLNKEWLPGGLSGVDIFFVISGYVVLSSMMHRREDMMTSYLCGFLARRAKRLVPSLLIVCSASGLALAMIAPTFDARADRFLRVGISACLGNANNWLVYDRDDYLDAQDPDLANLNPFMHLWSLGVEDQFYMIFPLLLVLGLGSGVVRTCSLAPSHTFFAVILFVCSVLSYILAWRLELEVETKAAAFYIIICRFWELSAGAFLLLLLTACDIKPFFKRHTCLARLLDLAALCTVVASVCLSPQESSWPAPGAILPTFAAMICITAGVSGDSCVHRSLSCSGMVFVGKLSYAIYLWHQPILALTRWSKPDSQLDISDMSNCIAFAVALGLLTYSLVEKPLQQVPMTSPVAIIGIFLACSAVTAVWLWALIQFRFEAGNSAPLWLCFLGAAIIIFVEMLIFCLTWRTNSDTSSFSQCTSVALSNVFRVLSIALVLAVLVGCRLSPNTPFGTLALPSTPVLPMRHPSTAAANLPCTACSCSVQVDTLHLPPAARYDNLCKTRPCFVPTPPDSSTFRTAEVLNIENCHKEWAEDKDSAARCLTPTSRKALYLVGDSTSAVLRAALRPVALAKGLEFKAYSWARWIYSRSILEDVLNGLQKSLKPGDTLVVTLIPASSGSNWMPQWNDFDFIMKSLYELSMSKHVTHVVVGGMPKLKPGFWDCARGLNSGVPTSCAVSRLVSSSQPHVLASNMTGLKNAIKVDMHDMFCTADTCDIVVPGTQTIYFADGYHLNAKGAEYLSPFLCSSLE